MIVSFKVMAFIIGRVDRMCQSFLSLCLFFSFFSFFFSTIVFGLAVVDFWPFLPVGYKFL